MHYIIGLICTHLKENTLCVWRSRIKRECESCTSSPLFQYPFLSDTLSSVLADGYGANGVLTPGQISLKTIMYVLLRIKIKSRKDSLDLWPPAKANSSDHTSYRPWLQHTTFPSTLVAWNDLERSRVHVPWKRTIVSLIYGLLVDLVVCLDRTPFGVKTLYLNHKETLELYHSETFAPYILNHLCNLSIAP